MLVLFSLMYLICYLDRGIISVAQPEIRETFGLTLGSDGAGARGLYLGLRRSARSRSAGSAIVSGPKKVLNVLIAWTSASAMLTGAATGFGSLLDGPPVAWGSARRARFPVASRGMQLWFAPSERGRIQGITHFFSRFAVAITPMTAGGLVLAYGWRVMFYRLRRDRVRLGRCVLVVLPRAAGGLTRTSIAPSSRSSAASMRTAASRDHHHARPATPWRQILSSPNMWWIALGYCCFFFGTNFYLTWYPTYLREYRGLSLAGARLLGIDSAHRRHGGRCRRRLAVGHDPEAHGQREAGPPRRRGARLPARRRVRASRRDGGDATMSILFLATSFFFLEWVIGPAWAVPMDVGGRFSGTVTGVMNMAGALAASLTPIVYGTLFGRGYWVAPFVVSAAVMAAGRVDLDLPDRSWKERRQRGGCRMIARLAVLVLVAAASLVAQGGVRPPAGSTRRRQSRSIPHQAVRFRLGRPPTCARST